MKYTEQIEVIDKGLHILAPAKINLSLLVGPRRKDGYHEIETLMAKVNWYDDIYIEEGKKEGIELICQGQYWAPAGPDNLVCKACKKLYDVTGKAANIRITLYKNIPAGSGLGSASSDAAAALVGVNKYLKFGLQKTKLLEIAGCIGSDIPFFLDGPLALCTGRGEKIRKMQKKIDFLALLVVPDVSVSTKRVYDNYRYDKNLFNALRSRINDLINKNRIDLAAEMCANMLQESCCQLYRNLGNIKKRIESLLQEHVALSGSGSSFFSLKQIGDMDKLKQAKCSLEEHISCKCKIVRNNIW